MWGVLRRLVLILPMACMFGPSGVAADQTPRSHPTPPLISKLSAPREVFNEGATFVVKVRPATEGSVHFAIKTYAGKTVWTRTADLVNATATVVLKGDEASKLAKGSRVLVATVNDKADKSAYLGIRLRGRVFRNVRQPPSDLRAGDEIIITDLSRVEPAEAISDRSEKGTWWRRRYAVPGGTEGRSLLCVEEQDLETPKRCLAPQLRLPLDLKGWYEIWVQTYRHRENGGVDVRLSGEKYFLHIDPLQVCTIKELPEPRYGVLVDVLYRSADLTGQHLVFQQPFGTYESASKLCNASLAGVRLIKLSDEQVGRIKAARVRTDTRTIGFDNDGFSYFHRWAEHDPACIARLLEPLRNASVSFLNYSLGGLGGLYIPTPYTGLYQMRGHTRHGDYRANAFFRWSFDKKVNIVDVLADRAHELGLKLFVSLMMERCYSPDQTVRRHPEWRIKRGRGVWDYALAEVQDYQIEKFAWIMTHHEIDGLIADYTRYGHYFNEDEPRKFEHMNAFLRKLRVATDKVNAAKKRKVLLCGSFGDRSHHLTHWGTGRLDDQGLDVKTWLEEGIFDLLLPEGPTAMTFVEMGRHSRTKVWPRKVCFVDLPEHKYRRGKWDPKAIERQVKWAYDHGAPGVFFFNHDTWTTLGRLGFKKELALRTRTDEVYGLREGPVVAFKTWYPNLKEREAQRAALRPVTIPIDAGKTVNGELVIPIPNTFKETVTATVKLSASAKKPTRAWEVTPLTRSAVIEPRKRGAVSFHMEGRARGQEFVPSAEIGFSSKGQTVFRHRLPIRAVSHAVCKKVTTPPTVDGRLNDSVWAGAFGDNAQAFFRVGESSDRAGRVVMATAYDAKHFYIACSVSGIDVSKIPRNPLKRDARKISGTDHVGILIDAQGAEQQYLEFLVTPAGAQADTRWYYYPFAGHFARKTDWNADWAAKVSRGDDSYAVEAAIPLSVLGGKAKSGDRWRINVFSTSVAGLDKPVTWSWATPETSYHKAQSLGTIVFE